MVGKWQVVDGMEEDSIQSVGEDLGDGGGIIASQSRWLARMTALLARIGRASSSTETVTVALVQSCHGFIGCPIASMQL